VLLFLCYKVGKYIKRGCLMLDIGQCHRTEYELTYGRSIPVAFAEAPGRIHFLGDQGEPENGYFLSAAVDRYIHVAVNMRKDNSFRFFAADLGERKRSTLANLKYRREDRWANHIKPAILLFLEMGYPLKGMNFSFCGDIPQHIALASSTAIEVAAATAIRSLLQKQGLNIQISDVDLAVKLKIAHDTMFAQTGVSSVQMSSANSNSESSVSAKISGGTALADYLALILTRKDHFLQIDTSSNESEYNLETNLIKSPFSRFRFLLVDSRVPRLGTGVESELASRKDDLLKGLAILSKKHKGAGFKDIAHTDLIEAIGHFPEQIRRRSMHIVDEIDRVKDAVDALERSDLASFAKTIYRSHESIRDLFEISCPEIDWLVKRAQEIEGAAGSRMTGIGFGGCTYTIIRRELAEEYKRRLEDYERIFGFRPVIYEFKLATRARVIKG